MPRWNTADLIDAPTFRWRNWFSMLGPALLMSGAAIGGGEWLTGPMVTARYGGALLWLATLSIVGQVFYNLEISRYTLYCGEPIFTGKFRTLPGPLFWVFIYLVLDVGMLFPYLAASAATPVAMVILGRAVNTTSPDIAVHVLGFDLTDAMLLKVLKYVIFVGALVPLVFGGKVYNSLRAVMTFKIVTVLGFLSFLALALLWYSGPRTWSEVFGGFVRFGDVPVVRGEDRNGNGALDPGEDWDADGHLDVVEPRVDKNGNGKDSEPGEFVDKDGDGTRDGYNVENAFVSLARGRGLPTIDFSMVGMVCAMVAIAGLGGLSNTPISNYTRDQGWGMGHHVGAIPSMVGGQNLRLSHEGSVFQITPESLARWRRWCRHVLRDQVIVWMPAMFLGLALPCMLSVEFLKRGVEADPWTCAGMTAGAVGERVATWWGSGVGVAFKYLTLLCGFLVLAPTLASATDGVVRRWVDVAWTASPWLRKVDPGNIRYVYFGVLCAYGIFGIGVLTFVPEGSLIKIATNIFNYALGISCWHVLAINLLLLPRELRPNWLIRIGLFLAGAFFLAMAVPATYALLHFDLRWI